MTRKAVLIINTRSRRGKDQYFNAITLLTKKGIDIVASYPVKNPKDIPNILNASINEGYKLIIIGGGDGTISSSTGYLAYKDVVMGILPLGTGNRYARTIGIPPDLEGAIDIIADGKTLDVDLGYINNTYFSSVASIGFSAEVASKTPVRLKKYLGLFSYGIIGIKALFSSKAFTCTFTYKDHIVKLRTNQIIISNGSVFGITNIYPFSKLFHNKTGHNDLLVFAMNTSNGLELLILCIAIFFELQNSFRHLQQITTKQIKIESDSMLNVDIDGEVKSMKVLDITVANSALKIIAPQSFVNSLIPKPNH